MKSSAKSLKSLKDTLLEYAVLNMDLIFPHRKLNASEKNHTGLNPPFPSHLFEEVLEISKDMCWPISAIHRIACIAARDRHKLSETIFFRIVEDFSAKDVGLITDSMSTLRTLKVSVNLNESSDSSIFNEISRAADSLEDLDLRVTTSLNFYSRHVTKSGTYSEQFLVSMGALATLKLKRLRLHMDSFHNFPFSLDSDMLTDFALCFSNLTESTLRTLGSFKRLVRLSFFHSRIKDVYIRGVIDAVVRLKDLRFLNLALRGITVDELMLNKITKSMENLEILELEVVKIHAAYRLLTPKRKLKVLIYSACSYPPGTSKIEACSILPRLAERTGHFENRDGLIAVVSYTFTPHLFVDAVARIFNMLDAELQQFGQRRPTENALAEASEAGNFNYRSIHELYGNVRSGPNASNFDDTLLRMVCHAWNIRGLVGGQFIREYVGKYVERNPSTHLAKKFSGF